MEIKTVNRRKLYNAALKGHLYAKCDGRYTDDYAWDAATNFGKMDHFLPVQIDTPESTVEDRRRLGFVHMDRDDFRDTVGRAWESNGRITLYIHSNLSYTVEIRDYRTGYNAYGDIYVASKDIEAVNRAMTAAGFVPDPEEAPDSNRWFRSPRPGVEQYYPVEFDQTTKEWKGTIK